MSGVEFVLTISVFKRFLFSVIKKNNIKLRSVSFERVEQLKRLGTTRTNRNSMHEEID